MTWENAGMADSIAVIAHDVRVDGYPNMEQMDGRVAFIFDGCVVSGWPLHRLDEDGLRAWEADSDVGRTVPFWGVTTWLEFPEPLHRISKK